MNQPFTHLHVHSQYSILDGACEIETLIKKTVEMGMNAITITDHGNMFGAKEFYNAAKKYNKGVKELEEKAKESGEPFQANYIKPIIGCEVYVAPNHRSEKVRDGDTKAYNHLILLAKNLEGYKNLIYLASKAYTEGYYYHPRIDKELLREHHKGLICSSACLGGEIAQTAMNQPIEAVETLALEFKELFGEDYYLELQLHHSGDAMMDAEVYERQIKVNAILKEVSKRTGIKLIATNDVHFILVEDAEAHDHLICLNTGKDLDDLNRMRYTKQEYLKSPQEMYAIFADIPEACSNTSEIVDKIEQFTLDVKPVMPNFPLPEGFTDAGEYLRYITAEGAKLRWETISQEIQERLDFELNTIIDMGFPGYFLIVWDFIKAAREMGVSVGPGRGSAAGSVVAYSLRITEIDPLKYQLLFERFLNPDRISMPDIDIDFDEDGREKVIDWVVDKYGENSVASIITFGTMAAKSAIKDVARIQKLPLSEANRITKAFPENGKLEHAYQEIIKLEKELGSMTKVNEKLHTDLAKYQKESKEKEILKTQVKLFVSNEIAHAREVNDKTELNTLAFACTLEGSVRQTGLHACGVIICADELWNHIPISKSKETKLLVTQYEGKFIEDVGMLKMDFLGLKTLSIIKDAVKIIKASKNIEIDIDAIPLDDVATFELFSRGDTTALFQFESPGMKKYLRELKPNRFEDLIAMNALYRPGPLEYIPSFIKRKHGKEQINYDVPEMEEFLEDTYGITVYQEQVMLLSQKLGNFTKGDADTLRKAMGKKQIDVLNKMESKFMDQAQANGHPIDKLQKIWTDWKAFAEYAFNKSHSTCYAYVAYQTGYLKAHFPAEFMAAVLSRNLENMDKITLFMDECKRMGMNVMVPDVNESIIDFVVNDSNGIRFGLGAIKGVGESASLNIIEERKLNGTYKDVYDFFSRVNLKSVNKRCLENLIKSGAFDSFGIARYRYFIEDNGVPFIDTLLRYGQNSQTKDSGAPSLFGDMIDLQIPKPVFPNGQEPSSMNTLKDEKDLIGIYLSSHPLDEYRIEVNHFCKNQLSQLEDISKFKGKEISVAGMVTASRAGITKNGKPYTIFKLEDFTGSYEFPLFGKDNETYSSFAQIGNRISIKGKVDVRYKGNDELSFQIQTIDMLSNLKKRIKNITISLDIHGLDDEMIEGLCSFASEKSNGDISLHFTIYDSIEKVWIAMVSKDIKIDFTNEFFEFIDTFKKIENGDENDAVSKFIDYRFN